MSCRPVTFFAGKKRIVIPCAVYLPVLVVVAAACAVVIVNSILAGILGTAPILPIPRFLQTIANVLGYFALVAAMIVFMMFLLGQFEALLANKRFTDFERLIPLSELLSSQRTIAPNVDKEEREKIIKALRKIAGHDGILSIIAPATAGDIEDGSIDRLFVTTTENAADFRRIVRILKCDDVTKVPTGFVHQIVKQTKLSEGSVWLLTWD